MKTTGFRRPRALSSVWA